MKIILGDNPFFGINHAQKSSSEVASKHQDYAATIDYAYEKLGITEMMISPHEQYVSLLGKVQSAYGLTVLIPMPQQLNKKVASSGLRSLAWHYVRAFCIAILSPLFLYSIFKNMLHFKSFRYQIFYIFFYLEAKKVINDLLMINPKIINFGLHNLMTDMLLASGNIQGIKAFAKVCSDLKKGNVLVTQNIPRLVKEIEPFSLSGSYKVCGTVNQLGYMTNPSLQEVTALLDSYPKNIEIWAMQILGSGAINTSKLDSRTFRNFDAVLIASRRKERLKELHDAFKV